MSHLKGLFKKFTGDTACYDSLNKQPIVDAEVKLTLFKDATTISIGGLESYLKFLTKSFETQLSEKFFECRELFKKYETRGEMLNPSISHVMGVVFGRLNDIQQGLANDVQELHQNIESNVLKPLVDYQKEIAAVKENRKELKEAYDRIEASRASLDKAKREVESAQKSGGQSSRLTMISSSNDTTRRMNDMYRLEEKVQRMEKDLDEATLLANEKYDKYTEGLYKRVSEECELTSHYLDYLKLQRKYHKQALKRLDALIPGIKDSLATYYKKPIFGCSLNEYVALTSANQRSADCVSPVIRKLIEAMCKQNVFNEEGIFRVAGSRVKMNCLLYAINAGYLDHLDLVNDFDVHCLAGVLKQYIRELPDSLLCDEFFDSWISAINAPQSNKVNAFRDVLQRLPKANSENLRYLIKFLARVVENSDKTKMTSTNMGICFGVSLLSASSSLNSSASITNLNQSSNTTTTDTQQQATLPKSSIDMNTATNVFDFLLTHHNELFPGEINFLTGQFSANATSGGGRGGGGASSTGYTSIINNSSSNMSVKHMLAGSNLLNKTTGSDQSLNQSGGSGGIQQRAHPHQQNLSNINESGLGGNSNRYSVMIGNNDTSPMSDLIMHNGNYQLSFSSGAANIYSASGVSVTSNGSANVSVSAANFATHRQHAKKSSMDANNVSVSSGMVMIGDENDSSPPNNGSFVSSNGVVGAKLANQINASSTISLDAGSSSPKLKPKKQAPAPPKPTSNESLSTSLIQVSSPSTSMVETAVSAVAERQHSPGESNNLIASQSTSQIGMIKGGSGSSAATTPCSLTSHTDLAHSNSLLSRITNANLPASTMLMSVPFNNNELMSSSPIPTRSASFKMSDSMQTSANPTNSNGSSISASSSNRSSSSSLPKPSIPPPSIPGRPPPIGFNLSVLPAEVESSSSSLPYPLVSPLYPILTNLDSSQTGNNVSTNQQASTVSSSSSASSSTAASISIGNSVSENLCSPTHSTTANSNSHTNGTGTANGQVKPPKPLVPRKPANKISEHINKFENGNSGNKLEDLIDHPDESAPTFIKPAHEITFL